MILTCRQACAPSVSTPLQQDLPFSPYPTLPAHPLPSFSYIYPRVKEDTKMANKDTKGGIGRWIHMKVIYVLTETHDCSPVVIPQFLSPSVPGFSLCGCDPATPCWHPSTCRPRWAPVSMTAHFSNRASTASSVLKSMFYFSFTSIPGLVPCQFLQDRPAQLFIARLGSCVLSLILWPHVTVALWGALELSTCCPRLLLAASYGDQPELPLGWMGWSPHHSEEAPSEPRLW